jgi:hypothetical protein
MSAVCGRPIPPDSRDHTPVPAPPMTGAEYLNGAVLLELIDHLGIFPTGGRKYERGFTAGFPPGQRNAPYRMPPPWDSNGP